MNNNNIDSNNLFEAYIALDEPKYTEIEYALKYCKICHIWPIIEKIKNTNIFDSELIAIILQRCEPSEIPKVCKHFYQCMKSANRKLAIQLCPQNAIYELFKIFSENITQEECTLMFEKDKKNVNILFQKIKTPSEEDRAALLKYGTPQEIFQILTNATDEEITLAIKWCASASIPLLFSYIPKPTAFHRELAINRCDPECIYLLASIIPNITQTEKNLTFKKCYPNDIDTLYKTITQPTKEDNIFALQYCDKSVLPNLILLLRNI